MRKVWAQIKKSEAKVSGTDPKDVVSILCLTVLSKAASCVTFMRVFVWVSETYGGFEAWDAAVSGSSRGPGRVVGEKLRRNPDGEIYRAVHAFRAPRRRWLI
jgi:hypothetical protein